MERLAHKYKATGLWQALSLRSLDTDIPPYSDQFSLPAPRLVSVLLYQADINLSKVL